MRQEYIALGIFLLAALLIFSGLWRRSKSGRVISFAIAIAAAVYLIVALPPSLDPWARPQYRHLRLQAQQVPMASSSPMVTSSAPSADGILVVALQGTFDITKSALNQLLRAATADQTRIVSDETVLQTIVGVVLTLIFALSGLLISTIRRLFVSAPT